MTLLRLRHVLLVALTMTALPATADAHRFDRDHDRMSDRWERRHGLSTHVKNAHRDRDRDGLTNRREYRAKTNPRDRDTDNDGFTDGRDRRPLLAREALATRRRPKRPAPAPAPAPAPVSEPTPAPATGDTVVAVKATTRPVGSPPLSDAEAAARVRRSSFEPRPENAAPNSRMPTTAELDGFYAHAGSWGSCAAMRRKITGQFAGTTDEIIQWAAWKWGVDEDLFRAVAATESWWRMSMLGDAGQSFGLTQVKYTAHPGTFPLSRDSTAFNADYYGGILRYYYEGCATWLNDPCCFSGKTYAAGDLRGSVGAWYSGRWYQNTDVYFSKVDRALAERYWEQPGF